MLLSAVTAADQKLVRTIAWDAGTHRPVRLAVTLEYVPPSTLREQQEREKVKVIAKRKLVPMEDIDEINRAIEVVFYRLLAEAVRKITLPDEKPVTYRQMQSLLSLSVDQVKAAGGLDTPFPLDSTDQTPLTEEQRKGCRDLKTLGDVAKENVVYLIRNRSDFRDFITTIIADISYFQDEAWEDQLKNS